MNIAEMAYKELFPGESNNIKLSIKYSGKFSDYNANVRYSKSFMEFRLSKKWRGVSKEIQIGLIQSLILKAKGEKKATINIDLYNIFIKKLADVAPKKSFDPLLHDSFMRVNELMFNNRLDEPNLRFGTRSLRKFGSYSYTTDTIVISEVLRDDPELLDFVMYHELLHKKLKFKSKNGRDYYHSPEFRRLEKKFPNYSELEKRLGNIAKKGAIASSRRRIHKRLISFFT